MSEQIIKEDETNRLLTELLTKHDETIETLKNEIQVLKDNAEKVKTEQASPAGQDLKTDKKNEYDNKMDKDHETKNPEKKMDDKEEIKKGESLPGSYRTSIDKAENPGSTNSSQVLDLMKGGSSYNANQSKTPDTVKRETIAYLTKQFIETSGHQINNQQFSKALPVTSQ